MRGTSGDDDGEGGPGHEASKKSARSIREIQRGRVILRRRTHLRFPTVSRWPVLLPAALMDITNLRENQGEGIRLHPERERDDDLPPPTPELHSESPMQKLA